MSYSSTATVYLCPDPDQLAVLDEALDFVYGSDASVPTWGWTNIYAPEVIITVGPNEPLGRWPVRLGVFFDDEILGGSVLRMLQNLLCFSRIEWGMFQPAD
jgi:hypothetical protein